MRPFANSPVWKSIDFLGEITTIPEKYSIHLFSFQCGFFNALYIGAFDVFRIWLRDPPSLFMNGILFVQLRLPFWVGVQIRPFTQHYLQVGFGWKGNGRFAILLRIQTDVSAAAGMDGANFGQAKFMQDGTK